MPTRIVVEGPQLEPLLQQVADEYGGRATIVSANKVRSGGLGGFFAKQRFELSVEVADDEPVIEPAPQASLLDLADAREDRFEAHGPETPAAPTASTTPVPTAPVTTAPVTTAPTVAPVRSGHAVVTPVAIPALSSAVEPRTPAMAGAPARASMISTSGAAFAEVMAGLQGDLAKAAAHPAPLPTPARPTPANGRRAYRGPDLPEQPLVADLRALGFPTELAGRATGDDPYQAVLAALAELSPPAPPNRPGELLVVVGELATAVRTADAVARALRLDPAQILLAGPSTAGTNIHPSRRITGATDAERRARKIERADTPYVVVVDAPIGVDGPWAESILQALDPTATWATVDATRKPGDTATHLRTLGRVDALAVFHAEICADPGTVLALPAPVALLDGAPAGAHEWAALLSRRLSERRAAPAGTDRAAPWR